MKFLVFSDIHLEHHADGGHAFSRAIKPFLKHCDFALIAGDICDFKSIPRSIRLLGQAFEGECPAFIVAGNHEAWGASVDESIAALDEACALTDGAVNLLDRGSVGLGEGALEGNPARYLHGCTLWFPPKDDEDERLKPHMVDFEKIRKFDPYARNALDVEYLWESVKEGDVVMTHHLPISQSIHAKYANSPINRFFVSDIEELIRRKKPALVVHGHTHESCDYVIGDTRIVCNPFGYLGHEVNRAFNPKMIIEVPDADAEAPR